MDILEIPQLILLFGLVLAVGFLLLYVRKVRPLSNAFNMDDKSRPEQLPAHRSSGQEVR